MHTQDSSETSPQKSTFPTGIIKRDGQRVAFEPNRIALALVRAGEASAEFDGEEAAMLTQRVLKVLRHRFAVSDPSVEQVQDIVEQVLVEANHLRTFRAYVAYRDQHRRLRRHTQDADRRRKLDQRVRQSRRLAGQGQRQSRLFARRADPQRLRQGHCQLLAVARLSAGNRPGAPRSRFPHPRP